MEAEVGMVALKMEEGTVCQRMLAASRTWEKETGSPLKSPEGMQPYKQLDLGLVKLISNVQPPEL